MANTKSKIKSKTLKSARSSKKGPTISFHKSAISKARVTAMKRTVQSVM